MRCCSIRCMQSERWRALLSHNCSCCQAGCSRVPAPAPVLLEEEVSISLQQLARLLALDRLGLQQVAALGLAGATIAGIVALGVGVPVAGLVRVLVVTAAAGQAVALVRGEGDLVVACTQARETARGQRQREPRRGAAGFTPPGCPAIVISCSRAARWCRLRSLRRRSSSSTAGWRAGVRRPRERTVVRAAARLDLDDVLAGRQVQSGVGRAVLVAAQALRAGAVVRVGQALDDAVNQIAADADNAAGAVVAALVGAATLVEGGCVVKGCGAEGRRSTGRRASASAPSLHIRHPSALRSPLARLGGPSASWRRQCHPRSVAATPVSSRPGQPPPALAGRAAESISSAGWTAGAAILAALAHPSPHGADGPFCSPLAWPAATATRARMRATLFIVCDVLRRAQGGG